MQNTDHIEWEKEVPFLASLPKKNPFTVPEGYFDSSKELAGAAHSISLYSKSDSGNGFSVPVNYFEELSSVIISRVSAESFKGDTGFKVPEAYFKSLTAGIISKTTQEKRSPLILKLWSRDLMKYSAAACIVLITATALFFNQQQSLAQLTASDPTEQMLYDIDEDLIIEHIQEQDLAQNNSQLQPIQMEQYILDNYSSSDIAEGL